MLGPILLVTLLAQLFSYSYLISDPHRNRFTLYLNSFVLSMILLVTGENFFTLFLGWEGVGLVSYLLVNYWYTRIAANHASLKAVLINRVGDFALS